MIMGSEGYITDETPTPEDFRFTEVVEDSRPYKIVGYAEGQCPDSLNPYGYTPPSGWMVTSCTWMPPGSHGVRAGGNTILVYCEPIKNDIPEVDYGDELTSIIKPKPHDRVEIAGNAYSIPNGNGFYIQQANYIRYAITGVNLDAFGYTEGEPVVAVIKLSPVYEDIIDLDQWGYIVEQLIDIHRPGEPGKPYSQTIGGETSYTFVLPLALVGLAIAGGFATYLGLTHPPIWKR